MKTTPITVSFPKNLRYRQKRSVRKHASTKSRLGGNGSPRWAPTHREIMSRFGRESSRVQTRQMFTTRTNSATSQDDPNNQVIDTAGPLVGGVYNNSSQLFEGEVLAGNLGQLIVTFNEPLEQSTGHPPVLP